MKTLKMPKSVLNKMLNVKKCDYVKGQLRDNIAKPRELWKVLKSLAISSKSNNNVDICLKENYVLFHEPKETNNILLTKLHLLDSSHRTFLKNI